MLEGLEVSEVLLSYALRSNDIFRFDSNYFQKQYLIEEKAIHGKVCKSLVEIGVELRSFGAYSLNNEVSYLETGVPFIRGVNMKKGRVSFSDLIYISDEANTLLWKSEVKPGMILLSMSGTIGEVAIASKSWKYPINSNQDIAKIEITGDLNSYFLYAFLLTAFGQNYLQREARGSVQQHVFLSQIEQFSIPIFSETFQSAVQQIVEKSDSTLNDADDCYANAELLLLNALKLTTYVPSTKSTNIKSFQESFGASGRLDAEHYQPKFDEIEALIKSNGVYCKRVEEIQAYNSRGMAAIYEPAGTVDMITQKHILETGLDYDNFDKTDIGHFSAGEAAFVAENDILIYGTGANIGRTQPYLSEKKAVACQDIIILRVTEDPVYVAFVINSFIGRLQTEKMRTGSAQPHLYPKDIAQFLIPFVDKDTQEKIREKIITSLALKKQSIALMETAKRAVEIAIEQDEQAALAHIEAH